MAAVLLFLIWAESEGLGDFLSRTIGVLSILVAAGTVITPVFHKLSVSKKSVATLEAEIAELKMRIAKLEQERVEKRD